MKRILLIDDEEGIRITFKRLHDIAEPVFKGQLEMDVAVDLEQAKLKIATTEYDAIIADLKFQGHGADATITWIVENHETLPPIVVLTGDEDIYIRRRCMIGGAADFWIKLDAAARPDLFFKSLYNRYLARYESRSS